MTYKRIKPKDYTGTGFCRCYIHGKKYYPRILICIHRIHNGVTIAINEKMNKNSWWEKASLPYELIPELQDILTEWQKLKPT